MPTRREALLIDGLVRFGRTVTRVLHANLSTSLVTWAKWPSGVKKRAYLVGGSPNAGRVGGSDCPHHKAPDADQLPQGRGGSAPAPFGVVASSGAVSARAIAMNVLLSLSTAVIIE